MTEPVTETPLDLLIVGAGFSGLYQLHLARQAGLRARVVEMGDGVGGTWYWNRYPGARCDTESVAYSYSFSPELEQEWTWSERYATQGEILAYLEHVADRFDLRPDIQLSTRVTGARFDEDASAWRIETDRGGAVAARFLVMATGCLSIPKAPEIEGVDSFAGERHFTSSWPREGVDVRGKRVGVIGTGSTGIQVVPSVAADAAQVVVFQRTPNFSVPAQNRPLSADEVAEMKRTYPAFRDAARASAFGVPYPPPACSAHEQDEAARAAHLQRAWETGGPAPFYTAYTDLLLDDAANEKVAEFVRGKIHEVVRDPEVARRLEPHGHPLGARRLCVDIGYYETFNEEHVGLVDLRETPLVRVTPTGVETTAGHYELDVLVFATGFDAMTGAVLAIDPVGRDGVTLREAWAEGPATYLGLMAAGFPNMFLIAGSQSPSVLTNMVTAIEQHVEWVDDCVRALRAQGVETIEPTAEAQEAWVEHVVEVGDATLFPKADSWYVGANVEGKPRVIMPYLGGLDVYRRKCDEVAAAGYEGFVLGARSAATA